MNDVKTHFNSIANEYDYWKKRNDYYYQNLKSLLRSLIPAKQKVWEIGCGTGDILVSLDPEHGWGTDISEEMISRARVKHRYSHISFDPVNIYDLGHYQEFDYVVMVDVMEHILEPSTFIKKLRTLVRPGAKVIVTVANPIWEPFLYLAEKLKLKMPEGPHYRLSTRQTEKLFRNAGFSVVKRDSHLLVPVKIIGSTLINNLFSRLPIIRRFNFIIYWVLE